MEGDASGYNNRLIEAWNHVQILRNRISFCVKFEDLYVVEIEFKGRWKQFMIILTTSVRKILGNQTWRMHFYGSRFKACRLNYWIYRHKQIQEGRPQPRIYRLHLWYLNEQEQRNLWVYINFWVCTKQCQNWQLGTDWYNTNCATKLTEVPKDFYNSNLEPHANYITWENFKENFYIDSGMWWKIIRILLIYKQREKSPMILCRNLQIAIDHCL